MTQRVKGVDDRPVVTDAGWDGPDDDEIGFDWRPFISVDPEIVFGKPRVAGTRLAVEYVLELFAAGWSEASILDNFPDLTQADLRAVFAYAASLAKERQERPAWMSKPVDEPDASSQATGPRALPLVARSDVDIAASFVTVRNDDIRQRPLPT